MLRRTCLKASHLLGVGVGAEEEEDGRGEILVMELIKQHFVIDTSGVCKYTENSGFLDFGISADILDKNIASQRPGRYLETFLEPVASFSQSMSLWRSMATTFTPKMTSTVRTCTP